MGAGGGAVARGRAGPGDSVNASGGPRGAAAGRQAGGGPGSAGRRARRDVGVKPGQGRREARGRVGGPRAARLKPTQGRRGTARLRRARLRAASSSAGLSRLPRGGPAQLRGGTGGRRHWRAAAAAGPPRGVERARPGPQRAGVEFDFSARPGRGGTPCAGAFLGGFQELALLREWMKGPVVSGRRDANPGADQLTVQAQSSIPGPPLLALRGGRPT